jgi:hypothetical protein
MNPMSEKDNFVEKENKNSGYLINTLDLLFSNLWLTVATYFLLKAAYHLTEKNFFSIYFKQYSFTMFLGIMILEGNLQFLTYLIFNELQMMPN